MVSAPPTRLAVPPPACRPDRSYVHDGSRPVITIWPSAPSLPLWALTLMVPDVSSLMASPGPPPAAGVSDSVAVGGVGAAGPSSGPSGAGAGAAGPSSAAPGAGVEPPPPTAPAEAGAVPPASPSPSPSPSPSRAVRPRKGSSAPPGVANVRPVGPSSASTANSPLVGSCVCGSRAEVSVAVGSSRPTGVKSAPLPGGTGGAPSSSAAGSSKPSLSSAAMMASAGISTSPPISSTGGASLAAAARKSVSRMLPGAPKSMRRSSPSATRVTAATAMTCRSMVWPGMTWMTIS